MQSHGHENLVLNQMEKTMITKGYYSHDKRKRKRKIQRLQSTEKSSKQERQVERGNSE